ncbi:MAG: Crp/Fnr family transcriptional regulator [Trichlorobacter sp.]|uniref:Crp/Fnr family transcriptional regulator n=1 Tax=Trichlorobacter sp. TaxID=2911007 RepID=UPI00256712DA|nr:Crp/Fnr family transcriptional regulator [Trichlorobacter sp.]MDK9719018.1 Crp/Fnr family transcriptional regulator [Trichlorobacter sp.]
MHNSKLWYLKKMDIFSGLTPDEYAVIDRGSRALSLKKRALLPYSGTACDAVYFVKYGRIKIIKTSPDGRELILDILGAGTLLGELVWEPSSDDAGITAEAMEETLLCMMQRDNFDHLMELVPKLSTRITKLCGLRLKRIQNRLVDMLYCSVEVRLARTLLNLSEEFGVSEPEGVLIDLRLTHNELAGLIASTRETVSAMLMELHRKGLIEFCRHRILLVQPVELTTVANR